MNSIRIKAFRSIIDSGEIELAPITAIIGKNSCGKSSFLRVFPLLKQSCETRISDSLLWYGDYVDFGDYERIKPFYDKNAYTEFNISIDVSLSRYRYFGYYSRYEKNSKINVNIGLVVDDHYFSEIKLLYEDQVISISLDKSGIVNAIYINDEKYKCERGLYRWARPTNGIIPIIYEYRNSKTNSYDAILRRMSYSDELLIADLQRFTRSNTSVSSTIKLSESLKLLHSQNDRLSFLKDYKELKKVSKNFKSIDIKNSAFVRINEHAVISELPMLLEEINASLINETNNMQYLKPIRASANRYYRVQGVSIEQLDSDGSNIPMILYNLTNDELESFEKWCNDKLHVVFSVKNESGHVSLVIKDEKNNMINLADSGFGYSQILPLVFDLWFISNKKLKSRFPQKNTCYTIIIEQPELHLHPAFQKNVIDLFASIINETKKNGLNTKIIFETHSETMINRIGELIYEKKLIEKNDVNIIAFEKIKDITTIKQMAFDDLGLIANWPMGFFS